MLQFLLAEFCGRFMVLVLVELLAACPAHEVGRVLRGGVSSVRKALERLRVASCDRPCACCLLRVGLIVAAVAIVSAIYFARTATMCVDVCS